MVYFRSLDIYSIVVRFQKMNRRMEEHAEIQFNEVRSRYGIDLDI